MDLKELLGEKLYQQVIEKAGDNKIAIVSDGNWFPKAKFDDVNLEKNDYKGQVDNLNIELGKLQKQVEDNSDASQTIKDLQKDIENKEKEMETIRKSNAIKFEVLKANPNDVADIMPHLKDEGISISDDGVVEGLQEQLDSLKETKGYLFKETEPVGTGGSLGGGEKPKPKGGQENYGTELAKSTTKVDADAPNPYEL